MKLGTSVILAATLVLILPACGKPDRLSNGDTAIPVTERAYFGTQCPYGDFSDPTPALLELDSCPTSLKEVHLKQPIQPLILQADCKKKVISARNFDHTTDSLWEMLPDGSFSFTINNAGRVDFVDDGSGRACGTGLQATVSGQVNCSGDRDKVMIVVDTVWNLKKDLSGNPAVDRDPSCNLPSSCYFHSSATMHQCQ